MSDPEDNPLAPPAAVVWDVVRRGASSVGRSVYGAYQAIDPDLRRHAYQLPLLGLMLLAPHPRTIEPLPDDGFRPIVYVHGLGGRPGNFFGIKTYFSGRGRTRSYAADFGSAATFDLMAEILAEVIDEVFEQNGLGDDDQIDLVAHSMGGLVCRLIAEDPRHRARIANIVTLGTPHDGSHLARLAATDFTRELRPGSEMMQRLDSQDFWGEQGAPLVTAFWSTSDTVVLPGEHARFDRGCSVEVEGSTHYGYLIDPSVWRSVWSALRG